MKEQRAPTVPLPAGERRRGLLRPKGHLDRGHVIALACVAALPLVMVAVRVAALPGVAGPGPDLGLLRWIGQGLNEALSLTAVPPDQRHRVLYLLLLPMSAVIIALARLTLGLRVLGFRSILISIGFRQSGIVPSLVLMGIVTTTILSVRPWLRRFRLPRYARISVIISIVVLTMLTALLLAPALRSDAVWKLAFFPVIVLGLLAEGIARSMEQDNLVTASWRAASTIVLAFLIAGICGMPFVRETMLQFPELVITQVIAVLFISEYLDLRLLQDWDARLAGMALPRLFTKEGAYRVAVVRNRDHTGVIGRIGRTAPRRHTSRSVQKLVDGLRDGGHTVRVYEGDVSLLRELRDFMPPHPRTGEPGGLVLNLAQGIQGDARFAHVPAMLEMAGVAYTGPGPAAHVLALDQVLVKEVLRRAGVPVPAYAVATSSRDRLEDLDPPVVVKPRHEASFPLTIVRDRARLPDAIAKALRRWGQEVVVEEHVSGRRLSVALLGNDPPECLPIVEVLPATRELQCPAQIDEKLASRLREWAIATFAACGCRDFARVDFRTEKGGGARFIEVHSVGILEPTGVFARAAREKGLSYTDLACGIVEVARARYLGGEPVRSSRSKPWTAARRVRETAA